ncbi:MAG TPA: hypothetical protein VKB80_11880 [Kofleriaceae bacterium]|nr:hypothetical protein [Kofleriaceae bacterium]
MRGLLERAARRAGRLRWMVVPVAAYLAVTALLPLLNGAGARSGFARHIAWVAGGCAAVTAFVFLAQLASDAAASARTQARAMRSSRHERADQPGGRA